MYSYFRPKKQFINEEKISAHFDGMHISGRKNNFARPSTMHYDYNPTISAKELEEKLKNANRITMCEEIRKLKAEGTPFLPNALFNRIEKPCTSLVLWQPPSKLVNLLNLNKSLDSQNENNPQPPQIDDEIDNNNSSNVDLNAVIDESKDECEIEYEMEFEDL